MIDHAIVSFQKILSLIFLSVVLTAGSFSCKAIASGSPQKTSDLFAKKNLVAWCIVPFDGKQRGPKERAAMLNRLGIGKLAYDYRAKHISSFDAEMRALKKHGIELTAWWFPTTLNDEARLILSVLQRHRIKTQLWVTGWGGPKSADQQMEWVKQEANRIRSIAVAANRIGCKVGLYNHGGWFGEPENQIAIIRELKLKNVGIVYNLHHGHSQLKRFPQLLKKMLPYLYAINLNGMNGSEGHSKEKILPIAAGDRDLSILNTIYRSGYKGSIGILNHTNHDAEKRLQDNLDGLDWLKQKLDGKPVGKKPTYRTWKRPVRQQVKSVRPFPENRVRDFYAKQAQFYLKSKKPLPEILAEFPGLDGGSFGHWGQNPEADNYDYALNEVDLGGLIAQVIKHDGGLTTKAVAMRIGKRGKNTAMFDPLKLSFAAVWRGNLVKWSAGRYGITSGVKPAGETVIDFGSANWQIPTNVTSRYLGFYRHNKRVVFRYRIGQAEVLDHFWETDGVFTRSLSIEGKLPANTFLKLFESKKNKFPIRLDEHHRIARWKHRNRNLEVRLRTKSYQVKLVATADGLSLKFGDGSLEKPVHIEMRIGEAGATPHKQNTLKYPSLKSITQGGAPQWAQQIVTTKGQLGVSDGPYAIDTITIPYRQLNPFRTPMRIGGFDFLPDGRAAVCTLMGDVWLVDGIDDSLQKLTWKHIAAGLHQPLGLVVQDGKILVLGRDQITRLHDTNADDEIDFYECVTNDFPTNGGNDFALTLHQDRNRNLYWFTRSAQFGMTKFQPKGKPESIATGLRGTNGTGVSNDGRIVLATAQEGSWTPASAIFEVGNGSYHGFQGPRKEFDPYGYQMPLCFIPRGIDNSCGDIAFVPNDKRWGPLAGKIIGTSFGYCQHYMILRETIGSHVQGGVVPLPGEFLSGAHRSRFNPNDGQFYVAGTDGWQSYAKENGSLQRVRYVGGNLFLPIAVETYENGLKVQFNSRIDPKSVRLENVFCQQWNLLYSSAYGSAEYSVKSPGRRGHDPVMVKSEHLLDDGKSVFVEIPHLHPVMQFHLHMQLRTENGTAFSPDLYYSIFHLRPPFDSFEGYTHIERKKRYPTFPIAKKYPRDARLVAQDRLGQVLAGVVPVDINAIAGLQYEPRRLRVPPGRRIALTVHNTDPSMSHNFVLVQHDRLEPISNQSMMLAADPSSIAKHYVPDDPGVICMSPILAPGNQYTIYFDSPRKKGAYPFLCTFPGHWKVMRGVLYVADKNDELPTETESQIPVRHFVRMWKLSDLANEADHLEKRSLIRGRNMFQTVGCNKCHLVAGQGTNLGPDLTKISERFRGHKLLKQILEPSSEINKKYQSYVIVTDAGKVVTGLLVKEEHDKVHIMPNPLKPKEITVVQRSEIEEMKPSKLSTMPKGLLMTLSKEEILDLLAYLESARRTNASGGK